MQQPEAHASPEQAHLLALDVVEKDASVRWSLATRVVFRFVFSYLALYCLFILSSLQGLLMYFVFRRLDLLSGFLDPLWHRVVPWVAKHILHLGTPITVFSNGSGDTTYDYVLILCELVIAAAATVVWSLLDRRRSNYRTLHQWLRAAVRLVLAAEMISYGVDKAVPLQFGSLGFSRLLESFGASSPAGLLWNFMAASKGYTMFSGFAELLGGVLLLFPQLTTLGALVSLAAMSNVFALNMAYDVPVKLFSLHFVILSVFLLVPEVPRLAAVFVFNRPVPPVITPPLCKRKWVNRAVLMIPGLFGAFVLCILLYTGLKTYSAREASLAVKPPLYGVWTVDDFTSSGNPAQPLFTQKMNSALELAPGDDRWQRLIFESPKALGIQLANGSIADVALKLDPKHKGAILSDPVDPSWKANFTFERPQPQLLDIQGNINGNEFRARLHRMDESKFLLTSRGFHWISEHPFFR